MDNEGEGGGEAKVRKEEKKGETNREDVRNRLGRRER